MADGEARERAVDACIGWRAHRWTLTIEEGQTTVTTDPCGPACEVGVYGLGDYAEYAFMDPISVKVAMATECPAYDTDERCVPTGPAKPMRGYESGSHYIAHGTRCDCNWWPAVWPVAAEENERLRHDLAVALSVGEDNAREYERLCSVLSEIKGLHTERTCRTHPRCVQPVCATCHVDHPCPSATLAGAALDTEDEQ